MNVDDPGLRSGCGLPNHVRQPSLFRRPRVWGALLTALAVTLCVLGSTQTFWQRQRGEGTGGPLITNDDSNGLSYSAEVGEVVSYGLVIVTNMGPQDVVLESAELVGAGSTEGVIVSTPETVPEGNSVISVQRRYPPQWETPKPPLRPISGTVVPPGEGNGVEILFAITPEREGRFEWPGVRVHYRVGDKRYLLVDPDDSFSLCVPRVEFCDFIEHDEDS